MELGASESQLPSTSPEQNLEPHPNFRLQRILVPVDFSDCSRKALQYAIAFVEEFSGELFLVHVVEPYFVTGELGVDMISLIGDVEKSAKKHLEALQKTIKPGCRIGLRRGTPAQEIINEAKAIGADLIITATHGRSGLGHIFMGSVAERVVQHAPCPVLVVRENEREFVKTALKTPSAKPAKKKS
ncbi:MAG: UspA domain protein [Verrucomicrobia bacterium]|nr:UspA domain protein [Verrucomicrobiota bacterium]